MTGLIITLLVLVIAIAVVAAVVMRMRRRRLQERFGPEYARTVEESDSRMAAERDLASRERRVRELDIRPLAPEARERYAIAWQQVQADFVDEPTAAVNSGDALVSEVMRERGYPTDDADQRVEDLSVEHSDVLDHYRSAHAISARNGTDGAVSTEELRQAMVHYRALFESLLGTGTGTTPPPAAAAEQEELDLRDRQRTEGTR